MTYQIISERKSPAYKISCPRDVYTILTRYAKSQKEIFIVITLNATHMVIATRIVTIGLLNRTLVHPREIFINAIRDNSYSIVVAHCHPSGDHATASQEDIDTTKRLQEAGAILGISLLDHIIFSRNGFASMMEMGLMSPT